MFCLIIQTVVVLHKTLHFTPARHIQRAILNSAELKMPMHCIFHKGIPALLQYKAT